MIMENDNGGEFASSYFITFCENFHVRICTKAVDVFNGLIERYNAVLSLTVTKTIKDT